MSVEVDTGAPADGPCYIVKDDDMSPSQSTSADIASCEHTIVSNDVVPLFCPSSRSTKLVRLVEV
eukprot:4615526-Amphidinium_carterae.2